MIDVEVRIVLLSVLFSLLLHLMVLFLPLDTTEIPAQAGASVSALEVAFISPQPAPEELPLRSERLRMQQYREAAAAPPTESAADRPGSSFVTELPYGGPASAEHDSGREEPVRYEEDRSVSLSPQQPERSTAAAEHVPDPPAAEVPVFPGSSGRRGEVPGSVSETRLQAVENLPQQVSVTAFKDLSPGRDLPLPSYPPRALEHGYSGTVIVEITISTTGEIARTRVIASSGYELLDRVCTDTIDRLWSFDPADTVRVTQKQFDFTLLP
ncbi:MAG: energy transducer TonB [Spirochaetia bacterium]|nr:energy transducer TonB [Spirochaetia bacterium]MCF7941181.1 energy transducer TonB [Spirochaetia bacterium]